MKRKRKKRATKAGRSLAVGALVTGGMATTTANSQSHVIWYPTLPPRENTWTKIKQALKRIFL